MWWDDSETAVWGVQEVSLQVVDILSVLCPFLLLPEIEIPRPHSFLEKWIARRIGTKYCRAGVPNLQHLMLDDLKWSWCNNNRNKVHSKCNALESSWNHPVSQSLEELPFRKPFPGAKKVGDCCYRVMNEKELPDTMEPSHHLWTYFTGRQRMLKLPHSCTHLTR